MPKNPYNIKSLVINNDIYYRKVIHTTETQQLVIMNIPKGQNIGMEIHEHITQFFKIEKGKGKVIINGKSFEIKENDFFIINPGEEHDVISTNGLKLYTIYSPPEHPPNRKQKLKYNN